MCSERLPHNDLIDRLTAVSVRAKITFRRIKKGIAVRKGLLQYPDRLPILHCRAVCVGQPHCTKSDGADYKPVAQSSGLHSDHSSP